MPVPNPAELPRPGDDIHGYSKRYLIQCVIFGCYILIAIVLVFCVFRIAATVQTQRDLMTQNTQILREIQAARTEIPSEVKQQARDVAKDITKDVMKNVVRDIFKPH